MMTMKRGLEPVATVNEDICQAARRRQGELTKPPGALGKLEDLAVRLAAMQGAERPNLDRVRICVFAGDHGVTEEKISPFPQAVTTEMIKNFARGGAAISVLARELGADLEVIDLGAVIDPGELPGVLSRRLGAGTANFTKAPAMTEEQVNTALDEGRQAVARAADDGASLFIGGEMEIGNTTAAAAIAAALLKLPPHELAGPGAGLDAAGVNHKAQVIGRALSFHEGSLSEPLDILRCLGGFEIAALTGAYLAAARQGLPALVDGFITTSAALVAVKIEPRVREWLIFSHASQEPGHRPILEALQAEPLLDLGMRLGEGSGAAVALPILRAAVALHNGMATFAEAGIPGKEA